MGVDMGNSHNGAIQGEPFDSYFETEPGETKHNDSQYKTLFWSRIPDQLTTMDVSIR
jgi:hypothetical protein